MYLKQPGFIRFTARIIAGAFLFLLLPSVFSADSKTKNIILMISDGRGFNAVQAGDFYIGKKAVYESFKVKYAMQTYSAGERKGYTGRAYNPEAMAKDFNYAKTGATDSASAATALFSGVKIYDHELNFTPGNISLETFFEKAAKAGKSIGAVSSVPWTHATPAAVYSHNKSRMDNAAIAHEAIFGSNPDDINAKYDAQNYHGFLKVVMGAGNPLYNNDGKSLSQAKYEAVGGEANWKALNNGTNGWSLITAKSQFEALTQGSTPDKVFGVPQVNETLQYYRSGLGEPNNKAIPYSTPLNTAVPDLTTMTKAAINVLDNNKHGFAIMIEGGATDWANHSNQAGRMIEEQIDFNKAVEAVVDYLNHNTNGNNWQNTLLIVTSDHESGYLWGDGRISGSTFFDVNGNGIFDHGTDYAHVKDNGAGKLPEVWFHSIGHSNSLVPLFAQGSGSELFDRCVIGMEPNLQALYNLDKSWTGQFIDNTCVYRVMERAALSDVASQTKK
jgi:alkaline phosphatase